MLARRFIGIAALFGLFLLAAGARADEPVLLKYKFAKGETLLYKSVQETKQTQTVLSNKIETDFSQTAIMVRVVDDVDAMGMATLKTKAERRRVTVGKDYVFDSKSPERDTTSEIGAAATPFFERLTGSEYSVFVNSGGTVVDVKGYVELIADLVKDNQIASMFGAGGGKSGAQLAEQEGFVIFGEKPVSPGDQWERPVDVDLPNVGTVKGKITYVYEGDDKVGERKTVRIGVTPNISIELKIEANTAKVSGKLSTDSSSGTVQFDPQAGRVVTSKRNNSISGQLTVEAGGMTIPVDTQTEETSSLELIDKIPD